MINKEGDYYYQSVRVRLPNGEVRQAELYSKTKNGYRSARVWIDNVRVNGRVTSRHGYKDNRVLPFEVRADNASPLGKKIFLS